MSTRLRGRPAVAAAPQALFNHAGVPGHTGSYFSYAVAADGEKFLLTAGLAGYIITRTPRMRSVA